MVGRLLWINTNKNQSNVCIQWENNGFPIDLANFGNHMNTKIDYNSDCVYIYFSFTIHQGRGERGFEYNRIGFHNDSAKIEQNKIYSHFYAKINRVTLSENMPFCASS